MSALPDLSTIFVLLLTCFALYLFTRDKLPLEASGLTILIILVVTFQLFPHPSGRLTPQAFLSGFGHQALITICALMMLGKGMETTGALQPLAGALANAWRRNRVLASLLTLVMAGVLSSFVNTTPIVIMLLPMLMGVAVRNKLSPSSVLMPVGLAVLLGGMATTIGTSTNLLVVAIAADLGAVQFSMFDFTLPVVIVAGFGMLYLWLIAPRLLPERKAPIADSMPRVFKRDAAHPRRQRRLRQDLRPVSGAHEQCAQGRPDRTRRRPCSLRSFRRSRCRPAIGLPFAIRRSGSRNSKSRSARRCTTCQAPRRRI